MKNVHYKWIALSCTSLGVIFSVLNSSTIMIALYPIMNDLHISMTVGMWALMIYMLSLTILVPSIGRVADIIGRKKLFISGFIVFTVGSILCSLSQNGWEFIAARFVQSVGGSLIVANSTPIVADAFPKEELGRAMGINGMFISMASVLGPILGGLLLYIGWGWQSIFYINVPIGIIGTVWSWMQLRELDVLPQGQKFDYFGTTAFTVGMTSLLIAMTFNFFTVEFYIAAVIFLVLFVMIENKAEYPMLDLRLFKSRLLAFAYSTNLLNGIARGAVTFLLVFYFEIIKGVNYLWSGAMLAPFAVSMLVMSPISGWLSDKFGSRYLSAIGLFISAVGLYLMTFISATTSTLDLIIWMLIAGIGSGLFFSPNTSAIMGAVPTERKGIAAGVRTMMNNAGSVISIALSLMIFTGITGTAFDITSLTSLDSSGMSTGDFITALRVVFMVSAAISLLAAFIAYLRGSEKEPVWNTK